MSLAMEPTQAAADADRYATDNSSNWDRDDELSVADIDKLLDDESVERDWFTSYDQIDSEYPLDELDFDVESSLTDTELADIWLSR